MASSPFMAHQKAPMLVLPAEEGEEEKEEEEEEPWTSALILSGFFQLFFTFLFLMAVAFLVAASKVVPRFLVGLLFDSIRLLKLPWIGSLLCSSHSHSLLRHFLPVACRIPLASSSRARLRSSRSKSRSRSLRAMADPLCRARRVRYDYGGEDGDGKEGLDGKISCYLPFTRIRCCNGNGDRGEGGGEEGIGIDRKNPCSLPFAPFCSCNGHHDRKEDGKDMTDGKIFCSLPFAQICLCNGDRGGEGVGVGGGGGIDGNISRSLSIVQFHRCNGNSDGGGGDEEEEDKEGMDGNLQSLSFVGFRQCNGNVDEGGGGGVDRKTLRSLSATGFRQCNGHVDGEEEEEEEEEEEDMDGKTSHSLSLARFHCCNGNGDGEEEGEEEGMDRKTPRILSFPQLRHCNGHVDGGGGGGEADLDGQTFRCCNGAFCRESHEFHKNSADSGSSKKHKMHVAGQKAPPNLVWKESNQTQTQTQTLDLLCCDASSMPRSEIDSQSSVPEEEEEEEDFSLDKIRNARGNPLLQTGLTMDRYTYHVNPLADDLASETASEDGDRSRKTMADSFFADGDQSKTATDSFFVNGNRSKTMVDSLLEDGDRLKMMADSFIIDRNQSETTTGSLFVDGDISRKVLSGDIGSIRELKEALDTERRHSEDVQRELEKERNAAAEAASEAVALISRLQEEKSVLQMEAMQANRITEEKQAYDREAIALLNNTLLMREAEKLALEKEVELYKEKLLQGRWKSYELCFAGANLLLFAESTTEDLSQGQNSYSESTDGIHLRRILDSVCTQAKGVLERIVSEESSENTTSTTICEPENIANDSYSEAIIINKKAPRSAGNGNLERLLKKKMAISPKNSKIKKPQHSIGEVASRVHRQKNRGSTSGQKPANGITDGDHLTLLGKKMAQNGETKRIVEESEEERQQQSGKTLDFDVESMSESDERRTCSDSNDHSNASSFDFGSPLEYMREMQEVGGRLGALEIDRDLMRGTIETLNKDMAEMRLLLQQKAQAKENFPSPKFTRREKLGEHPLVKRGKSISLKSSMV